MWAQVARIARFGIVGVAATLTHVAVLAALVELAGMSPSWANPLGVAAAVPVSYAGHYFFTYRATSAHGETFARFAAVALSSFAVSQAVVMVVEVAGGPYQVAAAIFAVAVPATNFVLFNLLVFRAQPKAQPEARPTAQPTAQPKAQPEAQPSSEMGPSAG